MCVGVFVFVCYIPSQRDSDDKESGVGVTTSKVVKCVLKVVTVGSTIRSGRLGKRKTIRQEGTFMRTIVTYN